LEHDMTDTHALESLSFVTATGGALNLWPAASGGTYGEMCATGRARGVEVVDYMRQHEAPMVLGHVVAAMPSHGPVEIGFFQVIAERAAA
jgi:hypothetical protein